MRGDSVRDLYAKTLALLGLGLLAGVGALVDYWPVGVGAPQVAAAGLGMPERLGALSADEVTVPRVSINSTETTAAVGMLASLAVDNAFVVAGDAIEWSAPEFPVTDMAVVPAPVPVKPIALSQPAPSPGPDFDPTLVYQMGATGEETGLFDNAVDMMKSTGSTIARGGAITGSSIVDAVRVVSGAFKHLKFF